MRLRRILLDYIRLAADPEESWNPKFSLFNLNDTKSSSRVDILKVCYYHILLLNNRTVIVDSLSESRLKSVRFLVEESDELMTSDELMKIIKINH